MNKEQVFEVLKLISDTYPTFEITQSKIDTWARLLKDQNPATIMRNTEKYVLSQKFPPTIADLREIKLEAHGNDFLKKVSQWKEEASGKPRS